jgi:hypothetical protein
MKNISNALVYLAVIVSIVLIAVWQLTGGDYYTKFEVVEQVSQELDENDPLVAAGFYDDKEVTETMKKDEFRLGLLPTPSGIFDKHVISVISILVPTWIIALAAKLWYRRGRKFA